MNETSTNETLTIDVWSDIACPWCWVGKRNLEQALEILGVEIDLRWHAFELNPDAPKTAPEKVDYAERLAKKYNTTREGGQAMVDRMVEFGSDAGLKLRFDRIRPSNTFDGHRLIAWAKASGDATEMKERLFSAYLNEGQLISDHSQLVELAVEVGLGRDGALAVLESEEFSAEVRQDEMAAQRMNISGVPFFLLAGQLALPGAQPPAVLVDALRQAMAIQNPMNS